MIGVALSLFALTTAQTLGLPMPYHPVLSGYGAAFDAGIDDSPRASIAVTGIATIGHVMVDSGMRLPLLTVAATASQFGSGLDGRALGVQFLVLSSLGVGVNRSNWQGVRRLYFPLAAFLPVLVCSGRKRIFELYFAPVWNFERVDESTGAAWLPSWGSLNGGMLYEWRSGLGAQMGIGDPRSGAGSDPYHSPVISLGVHWSARSIPKRAGPQAPAEKTQCGFGL